MSRHLSRGATPEHPMSAMQGTWASTAGLSHTDPTLPCRLASQPVPSVRCPSKGTRSCQLKGGHSYEWVAEDRQYF